MTSEGANCTATRWLSIIGIGEDGVAGLSPVAQRLVSSAELVLGGKRHLDLAGDLIRGRRLTWPSPIAGALPEIRKHRGKPVVVLASGDPFHYGIGTMLMEQASAAETLCLPQPSAFSLCRMRASGWSLQDVDGEPAWSRLRGDRAYLQPGARFCALGTARRRASSRVCSRSWHGRLEDRRALRTWRDRASACAPRQHGVPIWLTSRHSTPSPWRSWRLKRSAFSDWLRASMTILFENDGQLTKREVRAITLRRWRRVRAVLQDIGLGAG